MASAEYQRLWRQKNKSRVSKYMRTWRKKHPARALAYSRKWTEENREKVNEVQKIWHKEHAEELNARARAKRLANPEKYRAADRARKRKYDPESRRKTYLRHREKYLLKCAEYNKAHPEVRRTVNSRRRARLLNGGRHTTEQWLAKLAVLGMKCSYCQIELTSQTLSKDHVIPLSKGGTDDIENVVPSCLPCNQRKSSKLIKS